MRKYKINDKVLIPKNVAANFGSHRRAIVDMSNENSAGVEIVKVFTYSGQTFTFMADTLERAI